MSYSVDAIKIEIFRDEIQNVLNLIDTTYRNEEWLTVYEYLTERMKELKNNYGSKK